VRTLRELLFHVLADVSDREISLVFAHMPIPHAPVIYDRKKAQIRTGYRSDCSYSDNLKLMDDTLGEIRRAIGQSEATPNTVLVLNADHRLRTRDKVGGQATARVPLLVELPLAREGMEIRTALCLSRLKSMILALLDGEIQTADGLRKWASRNEGACP
jgi:arylsulfatase A-like enzyme